MTFVPQREQRVEGVEPGRTPPCNSPWRPKRQTPVSFARHTRTVTILTYSRALRRRAAQIGHALWRDTEEGKWVAHCNGLWSGLSPALRGWQRPPRRKPRFATTARRSGRTGRRKSG